MVRRVGDVVAYLMWALFERESGALRAVGGVGLSVDRLTNGVQAVTHGGQRLLLGLTR